jgi:inhibitor of cysteine peptidase
MRQISAAENGQTLVVPAGELLELALPENPGTGFAWQLRAADTAHYALRSDTFEGLPGGIGQGGIRHWQFATLQPGRDSIELQYRRPWETNQAPARTYTVNLHILPAGSE